MNNNLETSLNNTQELRNLIIQNPSFPLLIFCGEDCNNDIYSYELGFVTSVSVQSLQLYRDCWLDEDDYREALYEDMADSELTKDMSDEEYDEYIDKLVDETEFINAIVIYVG